ncbi:hypothetical protein KR054_004087, partial [Drosophila jambulina]
KKVYDNECLIFMNNISTLFSLPKISHQSASSLRNLIDTVSSIYGSLLSIGDNTTISNAMLIHLVLNRVDPVTKQKWEEQLDYKTLPLWSDFEKMLNRRYQHLSAEESTKPKKDKLVSSRQHNRSSFSCSASNSKPQQTSEIIRSLKISSASSLRNLFDTVSSIYGSLLSIGDDTTISNAMVIHLVLNRVDPVTKQKWEEQLDYETLPLWSDFEKMLNCRYQHLSAEESTKPKQDKLVLSRQHNRSSFSCSASNSKPQQTCSYCNAADHILTNCSPFGRLSVMQRFEFVKSASLCINCLRKGHTVSKCKGKKCRACDRSHHILLHRYTVPENSLALPPPQESISPPLRVILATSIVSVRTKSGDYVLARALLDSGS